MFEKALLAVDLADPDCAELIDEATSLTRGELWVAHVVAPQFVQYSFDPTFTGAITRALERDALEAAAGRLAEICEPFGIPSDHQIVRLGRPAEVLHALAQELGVDVIIIGAHERRGLRRLLGSTANAVLHGSPVNVLTLRLDEQARS